MCCAIKPIASWLLEEVVSVCRERCGGQGYLSCNRFGTFLGLAHAAMTAEGDNSVLMQKVAKEHLGWLSKNPPTMIKANSTSLSDPTYLHSLLQKVCIEMECLNQIIENSLKPQLFSERSSSSPPLARRWQLLVNILAVKYWIERVLNF